MRLEHGLDVVRKTCKLRRLDDELISGICFIKKIVTSASFTFKSLVTLGSLFVGQKNTTLQLDAHPVLIE